MRGEKQTVSEVRKSIEWLWTTCDNNGLMASLDVVIARASVLSSLHSIENKRDPLPWSARTTMNAESKVVESGPVGKRTWTAMIGVAAMRATSFFHDCDAARDMCAPLSVSLRNTW
jgi:hypothetical protein